MGWRSPASVTRLPAPSTRGLSRLSRATRPSLSMAIPWPGTATISPAAARCWRSSKAPYRWNPASVESGGSGAPRGAAAAAVSATPPAGFMPQGTTPQESVAAPPLKQDISLHYHYGDLDRTPVRGVGFQVMLPDDSVVTGRLDDEGRARIPEVTVGPAQMVQVLFQPDVSDDDDAPILAARERLKVALDAIVAQTRTDMASEWRQRDDAGAAKRWGAAAWQPGAGHGPGRVGLRGRNSRDGDGSGRAYVQDRPRDQGMDAAAAHRRSQWTGPQDRRDAGCRWQGDGGGQKIADFGDGRVNSTIGWQWKNAKNGKKSRIGELDEAAANVPVGERSKTKMNGGLERCK